MDNSKSVEGTSEMKEVQRLINCLEAIVNTASVNSDQLYCHACAIKNFNLECLNGETPEVIIDGVFSRLFVIANNLESINIKNREILEHLNALV
jgi:hypothetical protein